MNVNLLISLQHSLKGALRIAQTAGVLSGTGIGWLLGERPPAPRLIRQTFERLGATYIKLGQFIASSPSFFPVEYVEEFQLCLDQTDPLPYSTLEKVLHAEFGARLNSIFADINPQPLASASIAQVHSATLRSGEDVVVKIQKPGVRDILLTDLNFLYVSARFLEYLKPALSWASLSAIVAEIQKTMIEECDFLMEADNIRKFSTFLQQTGNEQVMAPKVYGQASTLRVLTMERLYGVPLTDLNILRQRVSHPENMLITVMNTWFASLMFCDFFHADLHSGNLLALDDGRIGFIDFGIVGRIAPATWAAMITLMEAIEEGDYPRIAEAMLTVGITKEQINPDQLAADLRKLFVHLDDLAPAENEINGMMLEIIALGERYGLHFPREFTLLLKQFLYFDRYIHVLAPDLNLFGDDRLALLPTG